MKEHYTSTEVGVLVESLRSEFRTIAEVVVPLREDMIDVKARLSNLESDMKEVKSVIRIALPSINQRLSALEAKVG